MNKDLIDQVLSMLYEYLSGIDILVVSTSLASLGFAIKAYRKGHNIKILERRHKRLRYVFPFVDDLAGDFITIQSSALRTPENWPGFLEYCSAFHFRKAGTICTYDGTVLGTVEYPLTISRAKQVARKPYVVNE
ncbi:unnamed protein product [Clonostachys rhizophaga]|uniref:Uncharacterized protein n=1 Tax=Clonostachys rhizophaga TaxID=160324 RepID=A0A9N9W1N1_9HYPO|nr:unnamed protein product [Clonostachys rhizophaga]